MVKLGYAAGTVGGAVETTSNVVRAAIQIIGKSLMHISFQAVF